MAKARYILKRCRSVASVRTITRTMALVATSQFKKLHDRAVAARQYADRATAMVADLLRRGGTGAIAHPLMGARDRPRRELLLVITSDRGLCGGYNAQVLRAATDRLAELREAGCEVLLHAAGKRGTEYLRRRGRRIEQSYEGLGAQPEFAPAAELADRFMDAFLGDRIRSVQVAYMQFVSSGQQGPAIVQVLPVAQAQAAPAGLAVEPVPYEFLPSAPRVLAGLLPVAVRLRVYQCFLDAAVSEHVARMTAMRLATENADEMIHDLTVRYHRVRQAQITTELVEIFGGRGEEE